MGDATDYPDDIHGTDRTGDAGEALWETPAAGVRRLRDLRNRGAAGEDGFSAGRDAAFDDASAWRSRAEADSHPFPDDLPDSVAARFAASPFEPSPVDEAGPWDQVGADDDFMDDASPRIPSRASLEQGTHSLSDGGAGRPGPRSFTSALAALASPPPRRRFPRKLFLAAVVLLLVALAAAFFATPRPAAWPPDGWIFAACDVGQGDGLALADGPHTAIVVDTGPDPAAFDRCLTGLGVTHIRLLLLTHFHADHIDGVPGALKGRTVDEIETTVLDDPPDGARKVAGWAGAAGIPVSRVVLGEHRVYGPVAWDVLWPDPSLLPAANPSPPKRSRSSRSHTSRRPGSGSGSKSSSKSGSGSSSEEGSAPNNASIVLRVRVTTSDGPVTLLLTGDIEPPAQAALLARVPDLTADILKVPHHGSAHQDPDLVARVRPRASVISVGKGNTYGHPAPRTLTLVGSTGARVFRTDDDGTVLVVGPASRLRVVLRG